MDFIYRHWPAVECGSKCNVEFVHFIWKKVEAQYMFLNHAIAILPDPDCFKLRLLCLRHYDVPSVGCSFGSGCAICRDVSPEQVRPPTGCLSPDGACSCPICTRQPPSLRDLAFNAHFLLLLNIERFELTRNVTYSHCRFACESGRVDIERLLPQCSHLSQSCIISPAAQVALRMLPVPRFSRGLLPQPYSLPPRWIWYRLFTHIKAIIGVLWATNRSLLRSIAPSMDILGTKFLNFPKRPHPSF